MQIKLLLGGMQFNLVFTISAASQYLALVIGRIILAALSLAAYGPTSLLP
jgi:hypothetical protein